MNSPPSRRAVANDRTTEAMLAADPMLVDVQPAGSALPGMEPNIILTSGAPLAWGEYEGGQRRAVIGAALFERLAETAEDAERKILAGEILVRPCHDYSCVGSVTGVTSASMPVLVVKDSKTGVKGHCLLYEGSDRQRLTYGVWNSKVQKQLEWIRDVLGPCLASALKDTPGIPLIPIMRRALGMGDELHSRNTAGSAVLFQSLVAPILDSGGYTDATRDVLTFLKSTDLFFLHVGMAAGKCIADSGGQLPDSTIITAMTVSEKEFALRVAGAGSRWFRAPLPQLKAKLFDGYKPEDTAFMGGESMIMETVGVGGLAAAAAFSLQEYSGGTPEQMVQTTQSMYRITHTEHPLLKIPALRFRGVPFGIDAQRVVETQITPIIHMGAALRDGGHAGAGVLEAPIDPFVASLAAIDNDGGGGHDALMS